MARKSWVEDTDESERYALMWFRCATGIEIEAEVENTSSRGGYIEDRTEQDRTEQKMTRDHGSNHEMRVGVCLS